VYVLPQSDYNGIRKIPANRPYLSLFIHQHSIRLSEIDHIESTLNIANRKRLVALIEHENKGVI